MIYALETDKQLERSRSACSREVAATAVAASGCLKAQALQVQAAGALRLCSASSLDQE